MATPAEVAVAATVHPTVRRRAESLVLVKTEELGPGELVTLARRASPAIIAALLDQLLVSSPFGDSTAA